MTDFIDGATTDRIKKYKATPDDVLHLRKIARAWHEEDHFMTFDNILDSLGKPTVQVHYLCMNEGEPWVGAFIFEAVMEQADLIYLYVAQEHRKKGFGTLLFERLISELKTSTKVEKLFLEVKHTNLTAQRLYEKAGMQRVRTIDKYYRTGEDAIVYSLDIIR